MIARALLLWGLAAAAVPGLAAPVSAGSVLERIERDGVLRCGASERPGFAEAGEDRATGLAVDLCRAMAIALLGPQGRIEFNLLESDSDFARLRAGDIDLAFLTGGTVQERKLGGALLPLVPVYLERTALMVPDQPQWQRLQDLAGEIVCFMVGSPAQRALERSLEATGTRVARIGFEEAVEMRDAYNVGRCRAVADEATALAEMRQDGGINHLRSRILATPLGIMPIFAMTGIADGRFSAAAAWVLHGLIGAAAPASDWLGRGTGLDPAQAPMLGLRLAWQAEVAASLGSYADMLRRTSGDRSPLGLEPGLNAPAPAGSLLPPSME